MEMVMAMITSMCQTLSAKAMLLLRSSDENITNLFTVVTIIGIRVCVCVCVCVSVIPNAGVCEVIN